MAPPPKPGTEQVGTETVRPAAPAAPGSQAPASGPDDAAEPEVIDVTVKGSLILSGTENGLGKRTPADEYRLTNRAGKGATNHKRTERNGKRRRTAQVDECT